MAQHDCWSSVWGVRGALEEERERKLKEGAWLRNLAFHRGLKGTDPALTMFLSEKEMQMLAPCVQIWIDFQYEFPSEEKGHTQHKFPVYFLTVTLCYG